MKIYMVLALVLLVFCLLFAAVPQKANDLTPIISRDGTIPDFYTVESERIKLTVTDAGYFGGSQYGMQYGLFYRYNEVRNPDYHTGAYALHSNPNTTDRLYGNNWDYWAVMPAQKQIPGTYSTASVVYWAHWNIEPAFDGVELEISTDNGVSWSGLHPTGTVAGSGAGKQQLNHFYYDGDAGDYQVWNQYSCDLTPYIGQNILLRFHLRTDPSLTFGGFFVDDVQILGNGAGIPGIPTYSFELGDPNMWTTNGNWGRTTQSLYYDNMMHKGEIIAGMNSSYVADCFSLDWQSFGVWLGPPLHIRLTNRWTVPSGQPAFDLDMYFYAPSGTGGGDYIIVDCYLKKVNILPVISNLYIASHMSPSVLTPGNESAYYDSAHKMAWEDDYQTPNGDCVGIMYLAPGTADPHSVHILSQPYWGNDSQMYNFMQLGGFDNPGLTSDQSWYTFISAGPYSDSSFLPQPACGVIRYTFAFVGGIGSSGVYTNAQNCRNWYDANLANSPQSYVKVEAKTLGNIKALYK